MPKSKVKKELGRALKFFLQPKYKRIVFCLGSNLGDRQYFLEQAILILIKKLRLKNIKKSTILENKALLLPDSPSEWNRDFYNMAISANIAINHFSPQKILAITQQIEKNLGKIKRGHWAPREIDIDIVIIEDIKVNDGETLIIPHPQLFNRDFFIKPINEIESELLQKLRVEYVS